MVVFGQPRSAGRDRLDLPLMIEVVACHGLDQSSKRHVASFRMRHALRKRLWSYGLHQLHIPVPNRAIHSERRMRVEGGVCRGPLLLVEGLYDVVRFGQCLPEAER